MALSRSGTDRPAARSRTTGAGRCASRGRRWVEIPMVGCGASLNVAVAGQPWLAGLSCMRPGYACNPQTPSAHSQAAEGRDGQAGPLTSDDRMTTGSMRQPGMRRDHDVRSGRSAGSTVLTGSTAVASLCAPPASPRPPRAAPRTVWPAHPMPRWRPRAPGVLAHPPRPDLRVRRVPTAVPAA